MNKNKVLMGSNWSRTLPWTRTDWLKLSMLQRYLLRYISTIGKYSKVWMSLSRKLE